MKYAEGKIKNKGELGKNFKPAYFLTSMKGLLWVRGSKHHLYLAVTSQVHWLFWAVTEWPAKQSGPIAELSLAWPYLKLAAF